MNDSNDNPDKGVWSAVFNLLEIIEKVTDENVKLKNRVKELEHAWAVAKAL